MKKSIVIHPFLLALSPVLLLLSHNIEKTYYTSALLAMIVSFGMSILIVLLLKLIIKDIKKAAIITSIGIVLFYSYGHIYNELLNVIYLRQRSLLTIYALIFIFTSYLIIRTRKKLTNLTKALNIFALILVVLPIINIILFELNKTHIELPVEINTAISSSVQTPNTDKKNINRDIYYIILDGYAHAQTLKNIHGYDNKEFEDYLNKKGFFVAANSTSNYAQTTLSLASSLNMAYINNAINSRNIKPLQNMRTNNKVVNFLKFKKYTYVNVRLEKSDSSDGSFFDRIVSDDFLTILYYTTMLGVLPISDKSAKATLNAFAKLSEIYKIEEPTFAFAHIVSPHPPYVFDRDGNTPKKSTFIEYVGNIWKSKDSYIDQLIFINKKIQILVDNILKNSKIEPIIIIQADHGTASSADGTTMQNPSKVLLQERMRIFNAYYLPAGGNQTLYDSITPVNSFRKIFNFYFNANYKILKDRNYFSDYANPHKLKDVTDIVKFQN